LPCVSWYQGIPFVTDCPRSGGGSVLILTTRVQQLPDIRSHTDTQPGRSPISGSIGVTDHLDALDAEVRRTRRERPAGR
jgi:hypothetical protein